MSYEKIETTCAGESRYLSIGETAHHIALSIMMIEFNVDIFRSNINIPDEFVKNALLHLTQQHTLLRSTISSDTDGNLMFVPLEISENDNTGDWMQFTTMEVDDVKKWVGITNDIAEKGFDKSGPLWKAVWLKLNNDTGDLTYTLITIFHHGIMDGKGAFDLVAKQFLPILCSLVQGKELDSNYLQSSKLMKSSEEIFFGLNQPASKQPVKWYVKRLMDFILWKQRTFGTQDNIYKPKIRVTDEYIPQDPLDVNFGLYPFKVDEMLSKAFIDSCKKNKVTVQSLLLVLLSTSIEKARLELLKCKDQIRQFVYPIDLRKFHSQLSTSPMTCGVFFAAGFQKISPIKNNDVKKYYKAAQKVNEKIKEQNKVSNHGELLTSALLCLLEKPGIDYKDKIRSLMSGYISLSNIGQCDTNDKQKSNPIQLFEHYFGITKVTDSLMLSTATIDGHMCFCIIYDSKWVSEEFAILLEKYIRDQMQFCSF